MAWEMKSARKEISREDILDSTLGVLGRRSRRKVHPNFVVKLADGRKLERASAPEIRADPGRFMRAYRSSLLVFFYGRGM